MNNTKIQWIRDILKDNYMSEIYPDELELAALLCSKVCHDVISPVGAITNGLEVLDEESDEDMRGFAMDLIRKSATQASAKLQFARLAYGAGGSVGAMIDLGDAASVTRNYANDDKLTLNWDSMPIAIGKDYVKILLNMVIVAQHAVPRGGIIDVTIEDPEMRPTFTLRCSGVGARIPAGAPELIAGTGVENPIDARSVQPYYMGMIAKRAKMAISIAQDGDDIILTAKPSEHGQD